MGPTIQLIHLALRVERENEAKRHPHPAAVDNFAAEIPARPTGRNNQSNRIFNLPRRRPQCECA